MASSHQPAASKPEIKPIHPLADLQALQGTISFFKKRIQGTISIMKLKNYR
jgi:hypothetical protein